MVRAGRRLLRYTVAGAWVGEKALTGDVYTQSIPLSLKVDATYFVLVF